MTEINEEKAKLKLKAYNTKTGDKTPPENKLLIVKISFPLWMISSKNKSRLKWMETAVFELLPLASAYNRTNGRKSGVHWRPSRIKEHYVSLWMVSKSIYNEVLYNSDWRVGAAPPEKWTLTPHFGPAIANAFQRAVHFLSEAVSSTFLLDDVYFKNHLRISFYFDKSHSN